MRFSSQRLYYDTLETSRAYVRSFEETPHYFLALELQDGAHPVIGSITAFFNDDRSSTYLGVFLVTSTAGRFLGNEAWGAVTEQFATQGELLSVTAGTSRSNLSMPALMSAAEFRLVGVDVGALITASLVEEALRYRRDFHGQSSMSPTGRPE